MKKLSFKQPSTNCIYIIPGAPKTSLRFFHATITSQERSLLENNKNPTNIKRYKFLHHDSHGHLTNTKDSPTGHYMFLIALLDQIWIKMNIETIKTKLLELNSLFENILPGVETGLLYTNNTIYYG